MSLESLRSRASDGAIVGSIAWLGVRQGRPVVLTQEGI